MKRLVTVALVFALLGLVASWASAQTPVEKPTTAVWDYTAYATAQKYELGYFAYPTLAGSCNFAGAPGASPTVADDLGKPASTTGTGITAPLVAKPIGCYGAKVRALDTSGLWTDWSAISNNFFARPPSPTGLVVK